MAKVKKETKKRRARVKRKCPRCKGSGYVEYDGGVIVMPCNECKGTGKISKEERVSSGHEVPAGVD